MTELHEELFAIANILDHLAERALQPEIREPLKRLQQAAEEVGRSASGSWFGHHANVYYEDFMPPPPGDHFSQEWGFIDLSRHGTHGAWVEYSAEDVKVAIRERAGNPHMEAACVLREQAAREFDTQKAGVSSILETATASISDKFLSRIADELDGLSISNKSQLIEVLRP